MFVKMKKGNHYVEYKDDLALYVLLCLIPYIGEIVFLIISIRREQFRGIWLNRLIISCIGLFILLLCIIFDYTLGYLLLTLICIKILYVCKIIILIDYAINANYYSINKRINEGYEIINENEYDIKYAISKARNKKTKFWQFTPF